MITELATYTPQAMTTAPAPVQQVDYQTRAVQRLGEWVASADAAYNVASRLVESSFVPAQFKGKPIEATAAILAGSEVGLSPMAALRSFDIIQGQAAPRAITLRAIVQSFGHEIVLDESTSTRCIMRGKRRGSSEWQRSVWTIDRAKDLGLTNKDGWKKQPTAMLIARATSEISRLIASDAILGIGYTAEELIDGAVGEPSGYPEETVTQEPTQAATRTMSRRKPAPASDEPTAPEPDDEEKQAKANPDGALTAKTRARMFALLSERGINDRDEQIRGMVHVIGRDITSRSELTEAEGRAVIARLEAAPSGEAGA